MLIEGVLFMIDTRENQAYQENSYSHFYYVKLLQNYYQTIYYETENSLGIFFEILMKQRIMLA